MPKKNSQKDSITAGDESLFASEKRPSISLKEKVNLTLIVPERTTFPIEYPIQLWGLPAPSEPSSPPLPTAHETMPPPPSSDIYITLFSKPTKPELSAPLPTEKRFLFPKKDGSMPLAEESAGALLAEEGDGMLLAGETAGGFISGCGCILL